jgi:hypothetical protein
MRRFLPSTNPNLGLITEKLRYATFVSIAQFITQIDIIAVTY